MADFQKGDVVVLKSGGPKMTVNGISDYSGTGGPTDGVSCTWFDEKNMRCDNLFDAATIEKYVPQTLNPRR